MARFIDTPGFIDPRDFVVDASPLANAISGLFNRQRQVRQQAKVQQAEKLKSDFKTTGAQMLRVRDIPELTGQRKELARLGQGAIERGEDPKLFMDALNITDRDELNLFLTRTATRAGDAEKLLSQGLATQKPKERFEPVFRDGKIVAQQNMATGRIVSDPRAKGRGRSGGDSKFFAPVTLINNETKEKRLVLPVGDPQTGQASLAPADIPEGFEVSTETTAEKRSADVLAKGQAVTAKGSAERRESLIEKGFVAAEGMANINRGLELLDLVETGGTDKASLKIKQFFGVEGANEAELSNRLGKAVLSQLRATFGAAFTAQEGAQLTDIEANFGKSTAGNRRLLEQTKKIINRVARRGIRSANAAGDQETAREIQEALDFRLSLDEPQASSPEPEKVFITLPNGRKVRWIR